MWSIALGSCQARRKFAAAVRAAAARRTPAGDAESLRLLFGGLASCGLLCAASTSPERAAPPCCSGAFGGAKHFGRQRDFWDEELHTTVQLCSGEMYEAVERIGEGSYSDVYAGISAGSGKKCVIKRLKEGKRRRLKREIRVLLELRGGPNIIELLDVVFDSDSQAPSLVMEHVESPPHKKLYAAMSDEDVREYMYELLRALDHCHSRGVMHRDVKPRNVVYDPDSRRLRLIDFGLAEFFKRGQEYNVRVSSLYYKAPELLVGLRRYDYKLDSWSVGCMLASLVFRKEPFFQGTNNADQLVRIARVLGTQDLFTYMAKHKLGLDAEAEENLGRHAKRPWSQFVTDDNASRATPEALDLLERLLVYDHQLRLTPREAMDHAYFDGVRGRREA